MLKPYLLSFFIFLSVVGSITAADTSFPEGEKPVNVYARVFILDVDNVDTANQTFTVNAFYTFRWQDDRLKHDSKHNKSYTLQEVWHPSILIINQQRLMKTFPEVVEVSPDGTVHYRQRVWGALSQSMDLKEFPFDAHKFSMIFASSIYSADQVSFVTDPNVLSGIAEDISLANFMVKEVKPNPVVYEPVPGERAMAAFSMDITADRASNYYILKVLLPLLLIVMMSWIPFWIDPEQTGVQIGISTTTMLTLIAYRFSTGAELPKIPYLTKMDYFILVATILVFLTLLEVVITSHLARHDKLQLARRVDKFMRVIFPCAFIILILRSLVF